MENIFCLVYFFAKCTKENVFMHLLKHFTLTSVASLSIILQTFSLKNSKILDCLTIQ